MSWVFFYILCLLGRTTGLEWRDVINSIIIVLTALSIMPCMLGPLLTYLDLGPPCTIVPSYDGPRLAFWRTPETLFILVKLYAGVFLTDLCFSVHCARSVFLRRQLY